MGTGGTPAVRSPTSYRNCSGAIPCRAGHHHSDDVREILCKRTRGDASQLNRLVQLCKSTSHAISRTRGVTSSPNALGKFYGQAERAISTRKLHALPHFHIEPIKHVVFVCPSFPFWVGRSHLEACFPLICIQRLSQPNFATERCPWQDSSITRGSFIPVLSY